MEMTLPSLREQGIQALREGNIDAAIDLLARTLSVNGDDAEAQMFLGVAYSRKGLHVPAKRALETAVDLRPQEARCHFNLGVALEQAGDVSGAVTAYRRALQINPELTQARARLQALNAVVNPPAAAAPQSMVTGSSASTWEMPRLTAGLVRGAVSPAGPAGTIQCGQCRQWSKPGLSCEWCSAPLKSAPPAAAAPWLQAAGASPYISAAAAGPAVVTLPVDMGVSEAFARRLAASLIDGVVLASVAALMIFGARLPSYWCWVVMIAYEAGMLATWGQTLGNMALGIRVIGPDGGKPSLWRAALRQVSAEVLSEPLLCLGYLWMLWDGEQQTWHDKIAGTHVERA
jgi:uncharacterized RDD family membrane protein YckC